MKTQSLSGCSLLALVLAFIVTGTLPLTALDAFQQNARLGRGVNLLGWDAVWQNRARGQVKDVHFELIREAGFQHVRINLHPLPIISPCLTCATRNGWNRSAMP